MMNEPDDATRTDPGTAGLIVIGGSAGGVDALLTVLAGLPADLPVPVVIAQHLDHHPDHQLADLLASRSALPVRTVAGTETLEPGTVYVTPAGRDTEVTEDAVTLHEEGMGRVAPSIDRLLASAARAWQESLIAVILSGTGVDGALGAQAVKGHGGTVIVQNPETARFGGMPGAVPDSAIDVVAELGAIGPLLGELCRDDALPSPEGDDEMRRFLDRVHAASGLDFSAYKRPTIERRMHRRMVAVGARTIRDYQQYIDRHPGEMQHLVSSFLIKVTRFFRDAQLFEYLRDEVLPRLIERARENGELRVWSAGCATGEEAYSLAMLIHDLLEDEPEPPPVRIFATDVSPEAVDFARHGVYTESALDDLSPDMIERHFIRRDGIYEVRRPIRGMIVFGEHDLSRRAPFPRIDLVLCRNVLIYFTPELQRRALQLFAFSLRMGGVLALGKAESVRPLPEYFTLEEARLTVFRRVGAEAPVPVGRLLEPIPVRQAGALTSRPSARDVLRESQDAAWRHRTAVQSVRLLDTMSAGLVSVERDYHMRSINVAARRLLGIRAAGPGEDLIHQVPDDLARPLKRAVDAAFRGETTAETHRVTWDAADDGDHDLIITCAPMRSDEEGSIDAALLEVVDVTPLMQGKRELTADRDTFRQERDALQGRLGAAITEIRELRAADQAMAIEQGRLRAENEQLQIATEEAQAAAEEIETLNEEQQAANEELETLNEELQATVEELNTTNADLQARPIELEEMAASLNAAGQESEAERVRLNTILSSMGEAVLVLDPRARVIATNAAWDRILGSPEALAPENEGGHPLGPEAWSLRRVVDESPFTLDFTLTGEEGQRRWFEAAASRIPDAAGGQGGMLVVRDITDRSLRRLQEQFLAVASHELRTPITTLSGSLQLLERRLRSPDGEGRTQPLVQRSRDQVRRLELLIAELTDVARLRGGMFRISPEEIDLVEVARQAIDTSGSLGSTVAVRSDLPEGPIPIVADPARIEQVLLNLLTNAFRHARDTSHVDLRLREEGDAAVFEVQDYGAGIAPGELPGIFSQFRQGSGSAHAGVGLGLGLFIAREIVEAHGGTIEAVSTEGEGTMFTIRLPLIAAEEADDA